MKRLYSAMQVELIEEVQDKLKDFNERLKRLETSLDKIQQSIIGKKF